MKKCTHHEVAGKQEHDQPRKTWLQCVNYNLKSFKLTKGLTPTCNAWRDALRMAKSPTYKKY